MKNHIDTIEKRLHELNRLVKSAGSDDDVQELFKIIHRPGWTTVAEVDFVLGILDGTIASLNQTAVLRKALLAGCKAVGETPAMAMH